MTKVKLYRSNRIKRASRVRATVFGTSKRPRLVVFRSNKFIYAQLVDDSHGKTLMSSSDQSAKKGTKTERAVIAGKELAAKAKEAGIKEIVFDRGSYRYHGRVKGMADGLREGGLKF